MKKNNLILFFSLVMFLTAGFNIVSSSVSEGKALKIQRAQTVVATVYLDVIQNVNIIGGDGCSIPILSTSYPFTSWSLACDDAGSFWTLNSCGDGLCGAGMNCSSTFDVYCHITWTNAPSQNWVGRCVVNGTNYYSAFTSPTSGGSAGQWTYNVNLSPSSEYSFQVCLENFLDN